MLIKYDNEFVELDSLSAGTKVLFDGRNCIKTDNGKLVDLSTGKTTSYCLDKLVRISPDSENVIEYYDLEDKAGIFFMLDTDLCMTTGEGAYYNFAEGKIESDTFMDEVLVTVIDKDFISINVNLLGGLKNE